MKKYFLLGAAVLAAGASPLAAETISVSAPTVVSGTSFDVVVEAQDLFGNHPDPFDLVISYGFDVTVSDPSVFLFTGATSGPLFEPSTTEPGTDVFGAATGFGIDSSVSDAVLATLHFQVLSLGSSDIVISSDLSNPFQGLQYLNAPFQESIAGTASVSAVPEPSTLVLAATGLLGLAVLRRRRR